MPGKARGRYSRNRGARSRTAWLDRQNATETTLTAGQEANVDLLAGWLEEHRRGITVLRMILRVVCRGLSTGSSAEFVHGVMPITHQAFITSGAIPVPGIAIHDWYLLDGDSFRTPVNESKEYKYDIRTARKLPGRDGVLVHTITNNHSGDSMAYQIFSRLLIRLP